MKLRNILLICALFTTAYSCIDDKGNYEYLEVDDVVIKEPAFDVKVNMKEPLHISPKFEYTSKEPINRDDFTYEWTIGKKIVSKDSVLSIPIVEFPIGSYRSMLAVTNTSTGMCYTKTFNIKVDSKYSNGWMVLYEKNNLSHLVYMKGKKDGSTWTWPIVEDDVYFKVNEEHLPAGCKKLSDHGYKAGGGGGIKGGGVTVIHNGPDGGIELNGFSLQKDYLIRQLFLEEQLPAGFELKDILHAGTGIFALGENGRVHAGRYVDQVFWTSRLSHIESRYKGQPLNIDHFIPTEYYAGSFVWLMYSKANKNFISVYDDDSDIFNPALEEIGGTNNPEFWKSGIFMPNVYHIDTLPKGAENFVMLDNMTMQVMGSGYISSGWGVHDANYMLILRDENGKIFLQRHHDELDRGTPVSVIRPKFHRAAPKLDALVNEKSQFAINATDEAEIIFSSNGVIYMFNPDYDESDEEKKMELHVIDNTYRGKEITTMELNNLGTLLGVGFSDGTVIIYKKPEAKDLIVPDYKAKEEFKATVFGDKIIDIIFKNGAPVQGQRSTDD